MIVLDTNVISELFRPAPDPNVMAWVATLPGEGLFATALTRGELLCGLFCTPEGRRRSDLQQGLNRLFEQKLAGHVLPYDGDAADAHAALAVASRAQGRASRQSDAKIAGIVRSRGAELATRNVRDFEHYGIALVDPRH